MTPPINRTLAYDAMVSLAKAFRNHSSLSADEVEERLLDTVQREYRDLAPGAVDEAYGPHWFAVHFGVSVAFDNDGKITNPVYFLVGTRDRNVDDVLTIDGVDWSCDRNSFRDWTQPFEGGDDAAHVITYLRVHRADIAKAADYWRERVAQLRANLDIKVAKGTGFRLVDYAVVTDREDWSHNVRAVGRFS
jgi:hypothetical protein